MIETITDWQPISELESTPAIKQWLQYRGSTTALLQNLSGQQLHIQVIKQAFEKPTLDEKHYLALEEDEVFVREIYMLGGSERCLFCRSIFPKKTLTGEEKIFTALNNNSLGHVIYQNPKWQRSNFEYTRLTKEHFLWQRTAVAHPALFARRSHFFMEEKTILVQEVFLPDLLRLTPP